MHNPNKVQLNEFRLSEKEISQLPGDSRYNLPPGESLSVNANFPGTHLHQSERESIPRRQFKIEGEAFMIIVHNSDEPTTYQHAISSAAIKEWMNVMIEEIGSMKTNQVWDLIVLRPRCKTIGNK